MRRLTIAAFSGAAALMVGTAANALTFTYTGAIDSYTVQTSGWYEIDAWGAQGGSDFNSPGGLGAMVGGRIFLEGGQLLDIVVGGQGRGEIGGNTGSGGGGGSFVFVVADLDLLLAAGGGGGTGWNGVSAGAPGLAGRNGGGVGGGIDGMGGAAAGDRLGFAGGGTGWLGPGASGTTGIHGAGGSNAPSFAGGETHGCTETIGSECENGLSGGFGGGGGASYNFGGGGGGYSGGGAGRGGGGGGSYIADQFYDFVGQSGVRSGNGLVTIDLLPVPEPQAWAMMIL
ncbi:MAG: hypothetical protein ACXU82_11755, partial [Caulobacteraceae bacterium]